MGNGLIVDMIVLQQCYFKLHASSSGTVQILDRALTGQTPEEFGHCDV